MRGWYITHDYTNKRQGFIPRKTTGTVKALPTYEPAVRTGSSKIVNEINWIGLKWKLWQTALFTTIMACLIATIVILIIVMFCKQFNSKQSREKGKEKGKEKDKEKPRKPKKSDERETKIKTSGKGGGWFFTVDETFADDREDLVLIILE